MTINVYVRDNECLSCGQKWTQQIKFSDFTENLSGENTVWCSNCRSRTVKSNPARIIHGKSWADHD